MSKPRIVLDTNILISAALLVNSKPYFAFEKAIKEGQILGSEEILDELEEVLSRNKFDKYITLDQRKLFYTLIVHYIKIIEITERITASRDSKDDKFLELAVNGNAQFIVTGDKDLLVLNPFRKIEILTVDNFLDKSLL